MSESRSAPGRLSALLLAPLIAASWVAPASAQYIGGNAPPLPAAPAPGTIESPAATLSRSVRILAANPKDFPALIAAGRAELDLGDLEAAVGFFGRADELRPNDPAPKVGMGAAIIQTGDARGALRWFDQAQRLGASPSLLGADRGLAHDLLGELGPAQADYRAALSGPNAAEARRRLALSQAMSGNMEEGLRTLSPLIVRSDPAALRVRAFVLALGGQQALAAQSINQAMPGSAGRISPFFALLPRLSVQQKAAAVHLGVFPSPADIQLAAAASPPVQVAAVDPRAGRNARVRKPKKEKPSAGRRIPIATPVQQAVATPPLARPVDTNPTVIAATPARSQPPQVAAIEPPRPTPPAATTPETAQSPQEVASPRVITLDRLSGIDRLLAQADVPPAPRPRVEPQKPAVDRKAAERKAAADKKAVADRKAAADKLAADKKAKADAAALGVAGSHWVQLAGGRNEDRMATEYKRLQAKPGSPLKGRSAYVSQGKDYFRLLVGPFDDAADARDFVNKLAKAKVDGFSWTRTPAQIRIEKLKL
ncbi:MAG TPA: SPOR domain-containing protein [Sphingomicrobium sp.]|nr:SPOR domain-containing protein [Sphingomicrobium sp.]